MQRCIDLAWQGRYKVAPNPMVGCVIVYEDKIIAEGFHAEYGKAHAEVNAINQLEEKNLFHLIPDCTLYVNLEPCSHHGKTPPCADLIIKLGFKKVVIGVQDIFSAVSGKGIQKLQEEGIETIVGVLQKECEMLNKRFITFHSKKRPWIILKWAQSSDGFISPGHKSVSKKISNAATDILVHDWRRTEQAILIGANTALADNPVLTVRNVEGKNPVRLLIDPHLKVPSHFNIYNDEAETIVFNFQKDESNQNISFAKINDTGNIWPEVFSLLHQKNVLSVLVEGGAYTLNNLIELKLFDEARIIISDKKLISGVMAPALPINESAEKITNGNDTIYIINN